VLRGRHFEVLAGKKYIQNHTGAYWRYKNSANSFVSAVFFSPLSAHFPPWAFCFWLGALLDCQLAFSTGMRLECFNQVRVQVQVENRLSS
jgi:hypothetical protein